MDKSGVRQDREARREKRRGHATETMIDRLNKKQMQVQAVRDRCKNFPKVHQRQENLFVHNKLRGLLFNLYL